MSIHLIGDRSQPTSQSPPVDVRVGFDGQAVVLELVLSGGIMSVRAPMHPNQAGAVARSLGAAIEQVCPGQLEPFLVDWTQQIKARPRNGEEFLAILDPDRRPAG